jgi:hypothetical protein
MNKLNDELNKKKQEIELERLRKEEAKKKYQKWLLHNNYISELNKRIIKEFLNLLYNI